MSLKNWKQYALDNCGYELKTTFGNDFDIADDFGEYAIRDTYNRAFAEWKTNVVYLTELVLVLNWKVWQYHETNIAYALLYNELCEDDTGYALDNLTGDDLSYFYMTTD